MTTANFRSNITVLKPLVAAVLEAVLPTRFQESPDWKQIRHARRLEDHFDVAFYALDPANDRKDIIAEMYSVMWTIDLMWKRATEAEDEDLEATLLTAKRYASKCIRALDTEVAA